MPELPDIEDYLAALRPRLLDATVRRIRIRGISLLRSYDPPVDAVEGGSVRELRRLGKRLVIGIDPPASTSTPDRLFLVLHLMIAGRLRWDDAPNGSIPARIGLAALDVSAPGAAETPGGTLVITEAGTTRRASLHVVRGEAGLAEHDRGGIEPLDADLDAFRTALTEENRTLKRALTDPRRFSGIGNAYSDEILHAARLSPVARTQQLDDDEVARLHEATRTTLAGWTRRLREETGEGFPTKVTAFRPGFAVHGRYEQPCPVCGTAVQRIRYASNETNYCPRCQTDGRVLADRGLSRLLKDDWPRTVDQLEGA